MRCAKCGADNPAGKRFCGDCGAALANRCGQCGSENPPEKKFCGDCGSALGKDAGTESGKPSSVDAPGGVRIAPERQTSEAIEGERKTVTALFADIKGSTELMEDLDPEEARAIIDPALKLMIEAAHRYDGYVVQSTGDGIFALFGAPAAHEDHPQRALYAALRMQEELKRYSAKVLAEGGTPIQGRVGINSGEVVVRSIQTSVGQVEYTPIGHTTNLASRMQTAAPVGSIAVTEATRKLCEGYFILKPLGATRVKGVSEPINVYEVTGLGPLRTRLQRAVGRGLTKFVGREREMEALKHAAERAKGGRGQIVAAMAEPGVGKSRLFFEFKATSQSGWMVLEAFSVSHGKASSYLPIIDLLRNYFDISAGDDERKRREKVAGRLTILDRSLEDTLPYLFSLLRIVEGDDPLAQMDGQIKKRRTLEAIKRILLRESLNQPLMVIFEDLHWIDEQTQELLNLFADSIGTARFVLLVNYRPEYSHQWNSKTYYTQLRLDPLGKESAEEMLAALLGDGKDLLPLKRLIIERTEGNPFFMEEIVQALFEDGVLLRNGTVELAKSMNAVKVPATVQAILASRIDRLPPDEKELLQTLAVIGREFALSLVRHIVDEMKNDELERMLADLQMAEFVYEQPATGDIEYIFKHALTQEVAYNSVLIERRKLLHERAGQALESMFAGQLDDHLDELAHHYSRSGNTRKAIESLHRAGSQAERRSAYLEAVAHLTGALQFIETLPEGSERIHLELPVRIMLARCLIATKGYQSEMLEPMVEQARALCVRNANDQELVPVLYLLKNVYLGRNRLRDAYDATRELLTITERTGDPDALAVGHWGHGQVHMLMGKLSAARKHLEQALAIGAAPKVNFATVEPVVAAASFLSIALWLLGYPDQALARSRESLAVAQRSSRPYSLVWANMYASRFGVLQGDAETAREHAEITLRIAVEHGFPSWIAWATELRGWALAASGQAEQGIEEIRRVPGGSDLGADLLLYALLLSANECTEQLEEALRQSDESLIRVERTDHRLSEAELHRVRGELLLRRHEANVVQAEESFRKAIDIARSQSAKSWELRVTMSLARLLDKQGRRGEARKMLAEIYGWFTEGFDTRDLKDAKALLDELGT